MCLKIHLLTENNVQLVSFQEWSHFPAQPTLSNLILNDKEKQEGCLQVTGDGEILRAEVQHISPKGRHTLVISSNLQFSRRHFNPGEKTTGPHSRRVSVWSTGEPTM